MASRVHQGLLGWDAGFYEAIARFGYGPFGPPGAALLPALPPGRPRPRPGPGGRATAPPSCSSPTCRRSSARPSCTCSCAARPATGALARRAAWLFVARPAGLHPGHRLRRGHCCSCARSAASWPPPAGGPGAPARRGVGGRLRVRRRARPARSGSCSSGCRWRWASGWTPSAGGGRRRHRRVASLVAPVAPLAGLATFLGWARPVDGDFFLPLRVQTQSGHHGGLSDPFRTLVARRPGGAPPPLRHRPARALGGPRGLLLVVACWAAARPPTALFATAVVLVALTGTNLDSFERYALSAFPLVIVGAMGLDRPARRRAGRAHPGRRRPGRVRPAGLLEPVGARDRVRHRAPRPRPSLPNGPADHPSPGTAEPGKGRAAEGERASGSCRGQRREDHRPPTAPVVVIGAGPAGLTAAYQLVKAGDPVVVAEADDVVGGISRTVERDGWRFDIGGHRFFTKVRPVEDLWHEILPDEDFLLRPRMSRIFYQGKYYDYPLKAINAVANLGPGRGVPLRAAPTSRARVRPPKDQTNYEGWLVARFGWRLYRTFFKTYTEKVWGVPVERDAGRLGRPAGEEPRPRQGRPQRAHARSATRPRSPPSSRSSSTRSTGRG